MIDDNSSLPLPERIRHLMKDIPDSNWSFALTKAKKIIGVDALINGVTVRPRRGSRGPSSKDQWLINQIKDVLR